LAISVAICQPAEIGTSNFRNARMIVGCVTP
jgi:hypothetical protein